MQRVCIHRERASRLGVCVAHERTADGNKKAEPVYGGHDVAKDEGGGDDGDDLLEDAEDGEGDDAGAHDEAGGQAGNRRRIRKLGAVQAEGEQDGAQDVEHAGEAVGGPEGRAQQGQGALGGAGEDEEGCEHGGRDVEQRGDGVRGGGRVAQQDLGEGPAQAAEHRGGAGEQEAGEHKVRLGGDHQRDAWISDGAARAAPAEMAAMAAATGARGCSRRNSSANASTNARLEDLHIAASERQQSGERQQRAAL
ncbi:hypothetical protein NEOLI_004896 [Neolecta irregularis DAH-3]|uniref:Uncharacterized protein n=1 Tax=Neolecta irregularis (strain DAH-3) TaxID=1198029 RepID=A0A1U7LKZ8_NEOID|nr:hypothetical protein NEOLI_004896 [Neolecta irregularis DAH-3]|eukprot:OLL23324.1 hypothetical protein NEOLI_004896 [Neolecta irregularis DAH-3]